MIVALFKAIRIPTLLALTPKYGEGAKLRLIWVRSLIFTLSLRSFETEFDFEKIIINCRTNKGFYDLMAATLRGTYYQSMEKRKQLVSRINHYYV